MTLRNPVRKPLKHRALVPAMTAALALGIAQQAAAQAFPGSINLGSLNGADGFRLDGAAEEDHFGRWVSTAGDVNGDGLGDLIVGAEGAGSYVVFGRSTPFASALQVDSLNGANGFRLDGASWSAGTAGDINGDGFGDLIVGFYRASPNGTYSAGSSYVVFGKSTPFAATLALGSLNGANGFRLDGSSEFDRSGCSVSAAGDVNGDGFGDLIVGAFGADPNGSYSGSSYLVFGKSTPYPATLALSGLTGANGFRLDGTTGDRAGGSVSAAGDVNGDGFGDLIVGANHGDTNGSESGSSYLVFGKSTQFAATLALSNLTGTNGFRLDGEAAGDFSGHSVSAAGDVNGDGLDDLIVGAYRAGPNGNQSGSSYVVFGQTTPNPATLALSGLTGANGFRLDGTEEFDVAGFSVSAAGDVNGDGFGDLIVGAILADPNGGESGSSYVVFGQSTPYPATLALDILNGVNGFRLDGAAANERSGASVSDAGDINGDGIDDLIIGAPFATSNSYHSGISYVVFGRDTDPIFKNGFE